jgi:hypothetical protein
MRTGKGELRRPKIGGAAHRGVDAKLVKAAALVGSGDELRTGESAVVSDGRGELERRSRRGEWRRRGGAGWLDGALGRRGNRRC